MQDLSPPRPESPKKLKNPTPKEKDTQKPAEPTNLEGGSQHDDIQHSQLQEAKPLARNRKKGSQPRKNKDTAAHRFRVNLANEFDRIHRTSDDVDDHPSNVDDANNANVETTNSSVVHDDDSAAVSLLLNCAVGVNSTAIATEPCPKAPQSEYESSHVESSASKPIDLPIVNEDVLQNDAIPPAAGDLQVLAPPVHHDEMHESLRSDTLADLRPLSPEHVPAAESVLSEKVSALHKDVEISPFPMNK